MENKVDLTLENYLELYDFKKNIELKYTSIINENGYSSRRFVSTDNAIKEIAKANESLAKKVEEQKEIIDNEYPMSYVKNMSVWEFIKWRRKK
jgi:hypothetical protein